MRTLTFEQVVSLIKSERAHQDAKYGPIEQRNNSILDYFVILKKELIESEEGWVQSRSGKSAALPELVQVAAVAIAAIEALGASGNGDAEDRKGASFFAEDRHKKSTKRILTIDRDRYEVRTAHNTIKLSPKEFDVLRTLADAQGRCLSRRTLRDLIWQRQAVDERTVDQHVARLRKKLRVPVIRTVPTRGYRYIGHE